MSDRAKTRTALAELVVAGGLTAIGLVVATQGHLVSAVNIVAGIGGNWLANLAQQGFQSWSTFWFTKQGVLNDDIGWALALALHDSIAQLESDWKRHPHYLTLQRSDPSAAKLTLQPLQLLQEDAGQLFREPVRLSHVVQRESQAAALVQQDRDRIGATLSTALHNYFYGYDSTLIAFVEAHLIDTWLSHFNDVLRSTDDRSTRAWRAWLQLTQDSLITSVLHIQQKTEGTVDVVREIHDWVQDQKSLPVAQRSLTALTESSSPQPQYLYSTPIQQLTIEQRVEGGTIRESPINVAKESNAHVKQSASNGGLIDNSSIIIK